MPNGHIIFFMWWLMLFTGSYLYAQDTIRLKGVVITPAKIAESSLGKKTDVIDSTTLDHFRFGSVADLISSNTPVYIKSYGPGGVASTALRGGNASHTAILWNGFNLQNSMLGQADLSLLPVMLFENVKVEYGGSASLWGSGAVAGCIHLDDRQRFAQGVSANVNLGAGSMGQLNSSASVVVSRNRFISVSKYYDIDSKNNFMYYPVATHVIRRQVNAAYHFRGFMQELKFVINPFQTLSANLWINKNDRRVPSYSGLDNKSYQRDQATRTSLHWVRDRRHLRSEVRAGYFKDYIQYTDSLSPVYSRNSLHLIVLENENYWLFLPGHRLNFGVNHTSGIVISNNYEKTRQADRTSFLAGLRSVFLNGRLISHVSGRIDHFSAGKLPVTGNVSLEYLPFDFLKLMVNAAKVYRQPTLNDLYWYPGGNVNLKPEEGATAEGNVILSRKGKLTDLSLSAAAYTRLIDNWILWVPGLNGQPSPVNVQQVWSRGSETSARARFEKRQWRFGASFTTGYVLSTIRSNSQENNGTVGRQLVYTPRYTVNGSMFAGVGNLDLTYYHYYAGYRFITSDNSAWLDPYHISSVKIVYRANWKTAIFSFLAGINNILNTNYVIIPGYPMPVMNYEFGISIHLKPKKSTI